MNRYVTLGIALFVALVGLALTSSDASACKLFSWGGHGCHGCGHVVSHDCGGGGCGHSNGCGGCGHSGGCGHGCGGCGHHGGCCDDGNGTVIQDQGTPKATGDGDVPDAPPPADEAKETSVRSNRIFRTASFRR
jgi:hypothetical protein